MVEMRVTVPLECSDAVEALKHSLGLACTPVRVPVIPEPSARERNCFVTVRDKAESDGGRMQLGWAVWQHENLFVEGEFHAVYDPGNSAPWIDLRPNFLQIREILVLADD